MWGRVNSYEIMRNLTSSSGEDLKDAAREVRQVDKKGRGQGNGRSRTVLRDSTEGLAV